jgi:UDP-N-acetylglucosamine 2-epimerase
VRVAVIVGTRPQIIKVAPVVRTMLKADSFNVVMVHTGQHYDYELSKVFFQELSLPEPVANLGIGSDTHARQTAKIMMALERALPKFSPDLVVIPGDTNSALAASLVTAKLRIPSVHLEAGPRSLDLSMPEEINRIVVDHLCQIEFAPTPSCVANLKREGLGEERIIYSGDTMLDALMTHLSAARKIDVDSLGVQKGSVLVTIHRQENTDEKDRLAGMARAIVSLTEYEFVFPVHPRTKQRLQELRLWTVLDTARNVRLLSPVAYETNLAMILNASVVLTDSGGLQKEAFWLGVPCVTVLKSTPWPETLSHGANRLVEPKPSSVRRAIHEASSVRFGTKPSRSLFGDGKASRRVCAVLRRTRNGRIYG